MLTDAFIMVIILSMMNGLKKTWADLTTGTGSLYAVQVLGLSFGISMFLLCFACVTLGDNPDMVTPILTMLAIAFIAIMLFTPNAFDCCASCAINFDWIQVKAVILEPEFCLLEPLASFLNIALPTPYVPPRRFA